MSRGLYRSYQRAGPGFLAYKLERLFTRIKNEEDRILHNDILSDVLAIIEGEEKSFFEGLTDLILYQKINRRKRLLFRLTEHILRIGQKKG